MSLNDISFEYTDIALSNHQVDGDYITYQEYAGGNLLSKKSKTAYWAAIPLKDNVNVYRMILTFPDAEYQTGHSRNLLSFTGNTKSLGTGAYEWKIMDGTGPGGIDTISTVDNDPNNTSGVKTVKTRFKFGSLSRNKDCTFYTNIRQYVKARHTNFRFTAWVKCADSGKKFAIQPDIFGSGSSDSITITSNGQWQYIDISLYDDERQFKDFSIMVTYVGTSGTTGTLYMIEPMLAVDGAYSDTYTWCPNAYDNYRKYPTGATWNESIYNSEERTAYLDGIDNTFTANVSNDSASNLYNLTVRFDYFGSNDGKYDDMYTLNPSIPVSAYDSPKITANTGKVYRSDQNGTANLTGDYFAYECTVRPFPIKINNPYPTWFRVGYRQYGTSNWTYVTGKEVKVEASTAQAIKIIPEVEINSSKSWEAILEYRDSLMIDDEVGYKTLQLLQIPSPYALIDFHNTGKGISFGRIATDDAINQEGMDLNMPMYLTAEATKGTVVFTTGDASIATAWTAVNQLTNTDTIATILNKITTMMKNVRYLYGLTNGIKTYYGAGDTFDLIGMTCAGSLTGSKKNLHFYIPLPKPIASGVTVSFPTSIKATIRSADGGYILENEAISTIGTLSAARRVGGVQVMISLTNAVSYTNNTPVSVYFANSSVISFS